MAVVTVRNKITASGTASPTTGSHTLQAVAEYSRGQSNKTAVIKFSVPSQSTGGSGGGAGSPNVAQQIYNDMTGSDEGYPHGVPPSWDFGPSLGEGDNISPNDAIEWWGALYVGPNGNQSKNTLVNVRACALYWLNASTGTWTTVLLPYSQIGSGFYSEDFSTDYDTSVPIRLEADGSFSFQTTAGKVAHFYAPWPRITVNPKELGGVVAIFEARLVLNNASGIDDRSAASFVIDVGADPYPSTTGPGIENNSNIGMGKFKYVTSSWRSFAMTTMPLAQLQSNPPPIDLTGILP